MTNKLRWAVFPKLVGVLTAAALLAGFADSERSPATSAEPPKHSERLLTDNIRARAMPVSMGPASVADIAEKALPSVVNIATKTAPSEQESRSSNPSIPEQFRDLLPDLFRERRGFQSPRPRPSRSLGSGFIYDSSGVIVTNNHVVQGADEITVVLSDGTKLDAEIIGRDPKTDIALLRVEPEGELPALQMGDSSQLRVGDWVMAIGNPFGLGGSVTIGIVSAQNRNINAGPYDDFIQTDAAINRGNSGGPLINMQGEVVGINSAIISPSGGSIGIGFAIPETTARGVIEQLTTFGQTRRGWLGVRIQSVSDDIAASYGMDSPRGALVNHVDEDGPAKKAGVQVGDIIVQFDGKDVEKMNDLPAIVAGTEIGKRVTVRVMRPSGNGTARLVTLTAVTARLNEDALEEGAQPEDEPSENALPERAELLGLTIADATPALIRQYGLEDDAEGAYITEIDPASPADEKGIRPGSRIVSVGGTSVGSVADVLRQVETQSARNVSAILMLLESPQGDSYFVALPVNDG